MDWEEPVMPSSSPLVAQEGSGTAMLVGLLEAWITRRDIIEISSAAEYLLCESDLQKVYIYIMTLCSVTCTACTFYLGIKIQISRNICLLWFCGFFHDKIARLLFLGNVFK